MSEERQIQSAIRLAASASNATRIDHRDAVAAFGPAVVQPLLDWVRNGIHPQFVIRVYEAIGRTDQGTALAALDEVARLDRTLTADVKAARERLLRRAAPSASPLTKVRGTGVLDQVTPFGPPVASGECMGITQKGEPCPNPGRYWVGDKLSCSRRHAEYR